ncbi:MAG: hypothetical protein AAB225_12000 [Acidobacteriota bacterium]
MWAAAASAVFKSRAALHLENLALRHQLGVLHRSVKRPKLTAADRLFWAWLREVWGGWRSALVIVKPETIIAWRRKGFRLFWTWKVRHGQPGRPSVPKDVRELIRKMSRENPLWGAPRIHGELLKLGIDVGETSVSKYLVLVHDRRRILHFNVTGHPTAEWTAQQLREEFPWDTAPRYLLRDRDRIFGGDFTKQVQDIGLNGVLGAPRSPWQRAYVERVIGTIRRECLDNVIVFNEILPHTRFARGTDGHHPLPAGLRVPDGRSIGRSRRRPHFLHVADDGAHVLRGKLRVLVREVDSDRPAVNFRQRVAQLEPGVALVADLHHRLGELGVEVFRREPHVALANEPPDGPVRVPLYSPPKCESAWSGPVARAGSRIDGSFCRFSSGASRHAFRCGESTSRIIRNMSL